MSHNHVGEGIGKCLYKVLKVSKTSTTLEIKDAYRKLAMALHPDRTDGDKTAAEQFKEAAEAYDTLSNHSKRTSYDMINYGIRKSSPPRHYRKVYSPRAPPGFKTFDPKRHYDMHYGDGHYQEEMGRARIRAKEAAGKQEYQSPLGPGFAFSSSNDDDDNDDDNDDGSNRNSNPYSKRSPQGPRASMENTVVYEESHFYDSGSMNDARRVVHQRERVRGKLHERREERIERQKRAAQSDDKNNQRYRSNDHDHHQGCTVM